jgi:hypothetical protein
MAKYKLNQNKKYDSILKEPLKFKQFKSYIKTLIGFYYEELENIVGGNLHVVLDDNNFEDDYIYHALERCKETDDTFGIFLCLILLQFTEEERQKII